MCIRDSFITVTKESDTEWEHIKPAILGVILEHFQSGDPTLLEENAEKNHMEHDGPDAEIVNKIKELLDTRVRPAVAQDGGDITFHGYESGIVYLHMQGACAGCPSSTITESISAFATRSLFVTKSFNTAHFVFPEILSPRDKISR